MSRSQWEERCVSLQDLMYKVARPGGAGYRSRQPDKKNDAQQIITTVRLSLTTLFRRSRQNSYLLRAFVFGYIVTSPVATLFAAHAE